ncbi:hypothetical protein HWA77_02965 [Photobacterium damselae subsp. damselae]|uniref:Uncharacterized protein n=1 Tax=Photobacterium damselae subsp. damselae TaxID=85581 RepID=A0A850QUV8_PHODD|nr:hypothetical protein [Photobacterium damselae subsp. damselae]
MRLNLDGLLLVGKYCCFCSDCGFEVTRCVFVDSDNNHYDVCMVCDHYDVYDSDVDILFT